MKKLTFILGIAAISLVACNKETTTIKADTTTDSVMLEGGSPKAGLEPQALTPEQMAAANTPVATPAQDPMMEEAKKNPSTTLAISEKDFDFKDVKKGETVHHRYEFTNTGKNPLIISAVKPGCGCTVPDYSKDPILPGKKGFVDLKFDSSAFDANVSKYADVYANVEEMPVRLTFSANVIK